jgi:cellulose synthase operon protein C
VQGDLMERSEEIDAWLAETDAERRAETLAHPYIEAASVLASFDPWTLEPTRTPQADQTVCLNTVLELSEPVRGSNNSPRWRLNSSARESGLRSLGSRVAFESALRRNPADPQDPTQRALDAFLRGEPLRLETLDLAQLVAAREVASWVEDVLSPPPPIALIDMWLERARLLEPMQALVAHGFVGRKTELERLAAYVGVLRPTTALATAMLSIRGIADKVIGGPRQPLYLKAAGGMGKSTLLARFILEHAALPAAPVPFIYLDFDRPTLDPLHANGILAEAVRQIDAQFPGRLEETEGYAGDLASSNRSLEGDHYYSSRHYSRRADHLRRFESAIENLAAVNGQPVVLVLDTFEQAQRQGDSAVSALWSLLQSLAHSARNLRVIVAGRGDLSKTFPHEEVILQPFGRQDAINLLTAPRVSGGDALSPQDAGAVFDLVGGVPLSLALARRVLEQEGLAGLRQASGRRLLFSLISAEEQQGLLNARIINHLQRGSPKLKAIADPGLILRRVTADVILCVLSGPCGLEDITADDAEALFQDLINEVGLFDTHREAQAVWHLQHVRTVMLPRLLRKLGPKAAAIHTAAVAYYAAREGPVSRSEEVYHRLWLGERPDHLWSDALRPYLAGAVEELAGQAKLWLADKLGVQVDADLRRLASQEDWERQTEISVRTLLTSGLFSAALGALHERRVRTPASPLFALEADALILQERLAEADAVLAAGLQSAGSTGQGDIVLALLERLIAVAERRGDTDAARGFAEEALGQADALDDALTAFAARIAWLRNASSDRVSFEAEARQREEALAQLTPDFIQRLKERPGLLEDAAGEFGPEAPKLLVSALEVTGIDRDSLIVALQSPSVMALADRLDAKVAEDFRRLAALQSGATTGYLGQALAALASLRQDPDLNEVLAQIIRASSASNRRQVLAAGGLNSRNGLSARALHHLTEALAAELSKDIFFRATYSTIDQLPVEPGRDSTFESQIWDTLNHLIKLGRFTEFLERVAKLPMMTPTLRSLVLDILTRS